MKKLPHMIGLFAAFSLLVACGSEEEKATVEGKDAGERDAAGGDAGAKDGGGAKDAGAKDAGAEDAGPEDAGVEPDAEPPNTDPITGVEELKWTWVDFPEAKCRSGSSTGIGVNFNSASDKLVMYLEGGGACYNQMTCALLNPASFGQANFGSGPTSGQTGILNRDNQENPVKDWNFVYIPYCTGDVFGGNNPGGDPGIGPQQYVGYKNMEIFLARIVPTFKDITEVLLTGVSAGGFGSAVTSDLVARSFPSGIKHVMIDDSGPPMSGKYLAPCLQDIWRNLWGFDRTFLAACGDACPTKDDYALDATVFILKKYKNAMGGFVSSVGDSVITMFYGFGSNNCQAMTPVSAADYEAGLMELRSTIQGVSNNVGTYYISGTQHTWIGSNSLYTTTVNGVRLVDWVRNLVEGTGADHVGP